MKSSRIIPKHWFDGLFACLLGLFSTSAASAQVGNAGSPIVFSNGNTVNTATINQASNSGNSNPLIDNPVQVLGTGGTLIGSSQLTFLNTFTGSGALTLNLTGSNWVNIGYGYYDSDSVATFSNGFTLQSGSAEFGYGTSIINGAFSITGNSTTYGNLVLTSNNISGSGGVTLNNVNGNLTFLGSGPDFAFNSAFNGAILANTSGTQNFGGTISGNVDRVGNGGTTLISSFVGGEISAYGGTVTLSGNGQVSPNYGSAVYLQGGSLILDNTSDNNNSRVSGSIGYYGGGLSLLGVNGGATSQHLAAPEFSQGLNTIIVTPGTDAGSSAILTFNGPATVGSNDTGSVDFQGIGSNSQIFITGQSEGPIGAWATVNGTDFATYDTTNGVETMSTTGRPSQVGAATSSTYVLGTGVQNTLTGSVSAGGVTMTTGTSLDLDGNTLTLGGWIQNGSAGTISDGTLSENYPLSSDIYITTNANLSLQTNLQASAIVKNGAATLTLDGAPVTSNNIPQFFVNAGTLALNVTTPIKSVQGQSTFVVGDSAGAAGSASLSLLGNNQFISAGGTSGNFVGVDVQPAGQFDLNGYNANLSSLEVDGGTVDAGGGTLTTGGVVANAVSGPGQIINGTLDIVASNDAHGPGLGAGGFDINNITYEDGLDVGAQVISSGTITKIGNGTLVLSNASNSYGDGTVGLILSAGTVALQNSGAAGSTNQVVQFNGGALRADSVGTLTLTNPIQGGGVITSGSDIIFAGGYTQTTYGGAFAPSDTLTINGYAIDGANYYSSNSGPGTLVLSGTASGNTTGVFSQDNGTLAFDSDNALPAGMALDYVGGIIEAVNNAHTIANNLTISSDITFAGSQALTFSSASGNTVDTNSGQVTRYIYVNGTGPVTINNLTNAESSTLVAAGTGTLVLSGDPSGFAATKVNSGTVRVKNTDAAGASLGAVTVNNQGTFGGTGVVGGLTTVATGGTLDPGDQLDAVGTLKFRLGLTLTTGALLNFDLGKTTGSDLVQITGGTFTAPNSGTAILNFNNSGDFGAGTYTLISWTNSSSALATDFSLGSTISGYQYNLFVSSDSLDLTAVAVPEPSAWAMLLGGMGLLAFWRTRRRRTLVRLSI